ncbi:MAG: DUF3892 domain-containing protein [Leptospira sp.]|nr:DUF3892 domain-containing protein [Leptospira sp.]
MSNSINYWVSKKRNDSAGRIAYLKVHKANDNWLNDWTNWSRQEVVNGIQNGKVFYTVYDSNGCKQGSKINVIRVNNTDYLRTDSNLIAKDNLDNLPDF